MTISKELLDEFLTGVDRPEDLLGDAGLMKELKIRLMERMLGAELTAHLGYEDGQSAPPNQANTLRSIGAAGGEISMMDHRRMDLVDPFRRKITYLRASVTDRCDFRCVYCMAEEMEFLPRRDLLTLEELDRLCSAFIDRGVRKLRLTGGEPLVRKNVMALVRSLSRHLKSGHLDELTLTTNGSQLSRYASALADNGVRRINVSVDTLDPDLFRRITRRGDLGIVIAGIDAARAAGIEVKINTVALKGMNEHQFDEMIAWAHGQGMDLTLIETMPLGEIDADRTDQYLPLSTVRERLSQSWTLEDIPFKTGGPARYVTAKETGRRIGFITPLTHNFCETCNRVRITATGTLFMCLGQDEASDLRAPMRSSESDDALHRTIDEAISRKPKGHDFIIDRVGAAPAVARHMSVTGG